MKLIKKLLGLVFFGGIAYGLSKLAEKDEVQEQKEEVDDEEPIDFGFLDGYDEEEGGYEDVEYAS